jgi:hypothetical protein
MPQTIVAADGGWNGTITGPSDGDRALVASVNTPLGQLLANQDMLRVAGVSTWTGLQYQQNGQATTVPQRLVYCGRDYSQYAKLPGWALLALVGGTLYGSFATSGSYQAAANLATFTPMAGATVRGHCASGAGLLTLDATGGARVGQYHPLTGTYNFAAALANVAATYSFPEGLGETVVMLDTSGGTWEASDVYWGNSVSWTHTTGTPGPTYVGVAKGAGIYAIATTTSVEWGNAAPGNANVGLTKAGVRGLTYDTHYDRFIVWSDDASAGGIFASTNAATWVAAGPAGLTKIVKFGTDNAGTWIAVAMTTVGTEGVTYGRVLVSFDGGTTWSQSATLEDEFLSADGCNQIGFGDRRFAILGANRAWFSGRIA